MPVILVGNKIDLRGGEVTNEALEDEIIPIMNEFKVCITSVFSVAYSSDLYSFSLILINHRKSRHALNVLPNFLSTSLRYSTLLRKPFYTRLRPFMTPGIMSVHLFAPWHTLVDLFRWFRCWKRNAWLRYAGYSNYAIRTRMGFLMRMNWTSSRSGLSFLT